MKRYWDSSALVDALYDPRVEQKAIEPGQFTRPHALAEVFSTITGGRLGFQVSPDDAAALIAELTAGFTFVELTADETRRALEQAQKKGARGGRVHDWLHAVTARKADVEELLTDNQADFAGLEQDFKLALP